MSRKALNSYTMLDAVSMAANAQSKITSVAYQDKASIHVTWTGSSPVGALTVEARNSEKDSWYTLDFGAAMSVSGNSGEHQIIFIELPFSDIRLNYIATSGTGNITAVLIHKTVGA